MLGSYMQLCGSVGASCLYSVKPGMTLVAGEPSAVNLAILCPKVSTTSWPFSLSLLRTIPPHHEPIHNGSQHIAKFTIRTSARKNRQETRRVWLSGIAGTGLSFRHHSDTLRTNHAS